MQMPQEECSGKEEKADAKALEQEPQQVFREQEGDPGWKSQLGERVRGRAGGTLGP